MKADGINEVCEIIRLNTHIILMYYFQYKLPSNFGLGVKFF